VKLGKVAKSLHTECEGMIVENSVIYDYIYGFDEWDLASWWRGEEHHTKIDSIVHAGRA
jgi:hypothetical protein